MEEPILLDGSPAAAYLKGERAKCRGLVEAHGAPEALPNLEHRFVRLDADLSPLPPPVAVGADPVVDGAYDRVYRLLVGSQVASLSADFADVAHGRSQPSWWRWYRWWMLAACVLIAAWAGSWLPVVLLGGAAGLVLPFRLRAEALHANAVQTTHEALSAYTDACKRALLFVREVELVVRGFRVGASYLAPVSAMEHGRRRNAEALRVALSCSHEKLSVLLRSWLQQCERGAFPTVHVDVRHLLELLNTVHNVPDPESIAALAHAHSVVCEVAAHVLLLHVRLGAAGQCSVALLLWALRTLDAEARSATARVALMRAQCHDWRAPANLAGPVSAVGPASALLAAVRTIGAKVALLHEGQQADLSGDIAWLQEEWSAWCTPAPVPQCVDAVAPASTVLVPLPEPRAMTRMGGLEVDVIGDSSAFSPPPRTIRNEDALERVLEAYLQDEGGGARAEESRRPTESREDRIAAMKARRAREDAARAEANAVRSLIGELQDVLQTRKQGRGS